MPKLSADVKELALELWCSGRFADKTTALAEAVARVARQSASRQRADRERAGAVDVGSSDQEHSDG